MKWLSCVRRDFLDLLHVHVTDDRPVGEVVVRVRSGRDSLVGAAGVAAVFPWAAMGRKVLRGSPIAPILNRLPLRMDVPRGASRVLFHAAAVVISVGANSG